MSVASHVARFELDALLSAEANKTRLEIAFALLNLGLIDLLGDGRVSAADAVRSFYHAENCVAVRKRLKNATADRIMSHGVQLPDLFEALSAEEAHREFHRELATMRELCHAFLENGKLVAEKAR